MKLQLKYVKNESKNQVKSANSFQDREFVSACLKRGKLFVV